MRLGVGGAAVWCICLSAAVAAIAPARSRTPQEVNVATDCACPALPWLLWLPTSQAAKLSGVSRLTASPQPSSQAL